METIIEVFRYFVGWCSKDGLLRKDGPEFEFYSEGWFETDPIYMHFPIERTSLTPAPLVFFIINLIMAPAIP